MCRTDNFCGCMSIESGAMAAFVFTLIFGILTFTWSVFVLLQGINTSFTGSLVIGTSMLVLSILLVVAGVFLLCGIIAARPVFVKFWLITVVLVYFVLAILLIISVIFESYSPIRRLTVRRMDTLKWIIIAFLVVFTAFAIYLWVVVLNFYWDIKPSTEVYEKPEFRLPTYWDPNSYYVARYQR